MSVFTGIIVYLLVFWTCLFAVLPWGNHGEQDKAPETMGGAPKNPRIKKKFIVTFGLSAIIWVVIYVLIEIEIIDFYAIADAMFEQDFGE